MSESIICAPRDKLRSIPDAFMQVFIALVPQNMPIE